MHEFVTSLQDTLYEHAQDYYREHARRVRRKRTRYPPPLSTWQPVSAAQKAISAALAASSPSSQPPYDPPPLFREGWHVRVELKLATFAEFAGNLSQQPGSGSALEHYKEVWETLASNRCLGSTSAMPPRTKRWAEAKVLVDTVSIRISKLHLYAAALSVLAASREHPATNPAAHAQHIQAAKSSIAAAMAQFQKHIKRFTELSTGWGIGDATFEFWSWLAKQ